MTDFSSWIGRHDTRTETISPVPIRLLGATLDLSSLATENGDPIPPMWHWLYFLPDNTQGELGLDGHPRRGVFFPDIPLRRRMFAGGRITIHRALQVGDSATLQREITGIQEKQGSNGPIVFVEVRHQIAGPSGLAITEHQTIVYTDATPDHSEAEGIPPDALWQDDITTDPVLLFRFSALTFNSHRIHYDYRYATDGEGYQDLVVHGPLILILLTELARRNQFAIRSIEFRARRPIYCGDTVHLRGTRLNDQATLTAYRGSLLAMEAVVR